MVEIGRFLTLHPELRCRVAIAAPQELAQRLRDLELEFFVADQTPIDAAADSLVLEPLEYEAALLCRAGHPVLGATDPAAEVARYPFAVMGPPAAGLAALREFLRKHTRELPASWMPLLALDQASALRQLLCTSDFVGASSAYAHAPDLREGILRVIPVRDSIYRGRVGPVRLRDRALSPAAEALWKALLETLREDLSGGSALERELR
jgi:DNA-binding transcriptional LysR family regulator